MAGLPPAPQPQPLWCAGAAPRQQACRCATAGSYLTGWQDTGSLKGRLSTSKCAKRPIREVYMLLFGVLAEMDINDHGNQLTAFWWEAGLARHRGCTNCAEPQSQCPVCQPKAPGDHVLPELAANFKGSLCKDQTKSATTRASSPASVRAGAASRPPSRKEFQSTSFGCS